MERYTMFMEQKTAYFKMTILPKLIYRFNAIPTTTSAGFFVEIDKLILNSYGIARDLE